MLIFNQDATSIFQVIDGGRVPPEYYRSFSKMEAASASLTGLEEDSPGTLRKSAVVDRQGFLDVPVRVDKAGTLLTWELHSEDVRFGIFYQDDVVHKELPCSIGDGGEVTEVIKPFRIKGRGKVAEEGAVTCTRPGLCKYTVVLLKDTCVIWVSRMDWFRRYNFLLLARYTRSRNGVVYPPITQSVCSWKAVTRLPANFTSPV